MKNEQKTEKGKQMRTSDYSKKGKKKEMKKITKQD